MYLQSRRDRHSPAMRSFPASAWELPLGGFLGALRALALCHVHVARSFFFPDWRNQCWIAPPSPVGEIS